MRMIDEHGMNGCMLESTVIGRWLIYWSTRSKEGLSKAKLSTRLILSSSIIVQHRALHLPQSYYECSRFFVTGAVISYNRKALRWWSTDRK